MRFENTLSFAKQMDANDAIGKYRHAFHLPVQQGKPVVYLTGNSLGLLPKKAREYVEQEFLDWQQYGVEGHFEAKNPWFYYHHFLRKRACSNSGR
jgi:kynureninase